MLGSSPQPVDTSAPMDVDRVQKGAKTTERESLQRASRKEKTEKAKEPESNRGVLAKDIKAMTTGTSRVAKTEKARKELRRVLASQIPKELLAMRTVATCPVKKCYNIAAAGKQGIWLKTAMARK